MSEGYIYVRNWERFQHPDVVRSTRMPWIRDYVDQLNNDAYLDLPMSVRAGLQDIRRLVADHGQGRCSARADYLQRRCSWPPGHAHRILKRLIQDGFIEVRASKAQATSKHAACTEGEEGSKEPSKKESEGVLASGRRNGAARKREEQRYQLARGLTAEWLEHDPPHLVAQTVQEEWPDIAPRILASLKIAKNGQNAAEPEEPGSYEAFSAPPSYDRDLDDAENDAEEALPW